MKEKPLKIIFAGDRDIAVNVLKHIIKQGIQPIALIVSDKKKATHSQELTNLCSHLGKEMIFEGKSFRDSDSINKLKALEPDYIIGIHFPYIIPQEVLDIPKIGVINLHPAFLPHSKGWHTPTWVILEGTPYGATLHFMDEGLDTGDIIHQKKLDVLPNDTANTLYQRVKELELRVFTEAWPFILNGTYQRKKQKPGKGNAHNSSDLNTIQFIDLNKEVKAGELINLLRALTTNRIDEAAYFQIDNKRYYIQIKIKENNEK